MVTNIKSYIKKIVNLNNKWFPDDPYPEMWYRGVNDSTYDLEPGAIWRKSYDEISAVSTFRTKTPTLINGEPEDNWDWYFLMQHYGLPTRLLDWTESPLQALQFALTNPKNNADPAIWVMDPTALNFTTQEASYIFIPQGMKGNNANQFDQWLPPNCIAGEKPINKNLGPDLKTNKYPIAIIPCRSKLNPRLHAQRGVFTLHGTSIKPLNELKIRNERGKKRLKRIVVDRKVAAELNDVLWTLGFNKSSTYPEPNSISDDIIKMYGH